MSGIYKQYSVEHWLMFWQWGDLGVVIVSPEGIIQECNATFARELGYATNEIEGKHVTELTDYAERQNGLIEMQRVIDGKLDIMEMDKTYITKRGKTLPAHLKSGPIFSTYGPDKGEISHLLSLVTFKTNGTEYIAHISSMRAEIDSLSRFVEAIMGRNSDVHINTGTQNKINGNSNQTNATGGSASKNDLTKWLVAGIVAIATSLCGAVAYIAYTVASDDPEPPTEVVQPKEKSQDD